MSWQRHRHYPSRIHSVQLWATSCSTAPHSTLATVLQSATLSSTVHSLAVPLSPWSLFTHGKCQLCLTTQLPSNVSFAKHLGNAKALVKLAQLHSHHLQHSSLSLTAATMKNSSSRREHGVTPMCLLVALDGATCMTRCRQRRTQGFLLPSQHPSSLCHQAVPGPQFEARLHVMTLTKQWFVLLQQTSTVD